MHHGLIPWLVIDWRSENIINSKVTRSTLFVFDDKVGRQVFIGETFKWMSPGSPSRYSLFVSASVTAGRRCQDVFGGPDSDLHTAAFGIEL